MSAHAGRKAHVSFDEGVCRKVWRTWIPQAEIDREIATHTAAEAAGVAPAIQTVGQEGGSMFMSMRRLGRNIAEYAATEPPDVLDAALLQIEDLYKKLDTVSVLHNNADPRNAVLDEAAGRWFLIDFGKARMREEHDCRNYNTRITYPIMAVRVGIRAGGTRHPGARHSGPRSPCATPSATRCTGTA